MNENLLKRMELLRDELSDSKNSISDIMRRAYIIGKQIGEQNFVDWLHKELKGYDQKSDVPEYRVIHGQLYGTDEAGNGHLTIVRNLENSNVFSSQSINFPISHIENIVKDTNPGQNININLNDSLVDILRETKPGSIDFYIKYPRAIIKSILDQISLRLLEFIIDLIEKYPTLSNGDDSDEIQELVEKEAKKLANNPTYITANTINLNVSQYSSIVESMLNQQGIDPKKYEELILLINESEKNNKSDSKKSIPQKLSDYLNRNKEWLSDSVIRSVISFFSGSAL